MAESNVKHVFGALTSRGTDHELIVIATKAARARVTYWCTRHVRLVQHKSRSFAGIAQAPQLRRRLTNPECMLVRSTEPFEDRGKNASPCLYSKLEGIYSLAKTPFVGNHVGREHS